MRSHAKLLTLAIAVLFVVSMLAGCTGSAAPAATSAPASGTTASAPAATAPAAGAATKAPAAATTPAGAATPAAAAAPAGDVITLKFHHHDPPASINAKEGHDVFAKRIEEATKGKVKVQVYPSETLGKAKDAVDMTINGITDIAWVFTGMTPGRFPLTESIMLPYMGLKTSLQGSQVMQELYETTPEIQKEWKDVKVLLFHTQSSAALGTANKKIEKMEDLKGLRIRTTGWAPTQMIQKLGASPVTIPAPELYDALDKGAVDGYTHDWAAIHAFKLTEVTKYIYACELYTGPLVVIMNQKKFDSLPKDVQDAINSVSGMTGAKKYSEAFDLGHTTIEKDPGKATIVKMTPEEQARWQKIAEDVQAAYVKDLASKGLNAQPVIDKIKQLAKKYAQ